MDNRCPGSNFTAQVSQVFYAVDGSEAGSPMYVQVQIETDSGHHHCWTAAPKDLTAAKLMKTFYDLVVDPKYEKNLTHLLRRQLAELLGQKPYTALQEAADQDRRPGIFLSRGGWQKLPSGQTVFVAGDQVIGSAQKDFLIDPTIARIHLPVHAGGHTDFLTRFLEILRLEPDVYPAVWSFTLVTAMLSMIAQTDIKFQAVAFVMGPYGTGKSTIIERLFSLYDVTGRPGQTALFFDAGSTTAALRTSLSAFRDIPIVLDDLCTSGDRETVRGRKQVAAKTLRLTTNKTVQAKGVGNTYEELFATAGLAITAELGMESGSEWSRILPICLRTGMTPLPPKTREYAGMVLYAFLNWVAPQYNEMLEKLQSDYQQSLASVPSQEWRTNTMLFVVEWFSYQFCCFCEKHGGLTDVDANSLFEKFDTALSLCVRFQEEQSRRFAEKEMPPSIEQILQQGIESGTLSICTKKKKISNCAGLENNGKLYLWPTVVFDWITRQDGYQSYTKLKISKELKKSGVLIQEYSNATDNTVHLEISGKRQRFLCIDKEKLLLAAVQKTTANQ